MFKKSYIWDSIALFWWLITTLLSLLPSDHIKNAMTLNDKLLHFSFYMVFMLTFLCAHLAGKSFIGSKKLIFWAVIIGLWGTLLEVMQIYVPGRSFDWWDMACNTAGVVVMWLSWVVFCRKNASVYKSTNVLIVANTSWNIYNFRKPLVDALINKGYTVSLVAPIDKYSNQLKSWDCVFYPLPMSPKGGNFISELLLMLRLSKLLFFTRPNLIYSFTIKPNIYVSLLAAFFNVKVIPTVTGLGTVFLNSGIKSTIAKKLYRVAFKNCSFVFFQNTNDRSVFIDEGFVLPNQIEVVPGSGIDILKYNYQPKAKSEVFVFLMVARLLKDKGTYEYVNASKIIKNKHANVRFLLIGDFNENDSLMVLKDDLEAWIKEGLITYIPHNDQIVDYLHNADVVVLPSYREGLSKALLEAAACGKPLICSDVPGCIEIIQNNNGWACHAKDAKSLANAMERALLTDAVELSEMGKRSSQLVAERYTFDKVVEAYLKYV